jgi:CheY-like chemotaxis protein
MTRASYALIAEDNPGDVFLLQEVLRDFKGPLQLIWVEDGAEAMAWLDNRRKNPAQYNLAFVLLDLNLPRYSGLDVLRRIRGERSLSRTPVVIMSSSDNERDREAAAQFGANAYFHKPSDFASYMNLENVLWRLLGRKQGGESLASDVHYPLGRNAHDYTGSPVGSLLDSTPTVYKQSGSDTRTFSVSTRGYVPRRQVHGAWTFRRRRKFGAAKVDAAAAAGSGELAL